MILKVDQDGTTFAYWAWLKAVNRTGWILFFEHLLQQVLGKPQFTPRFAVEREHIALQLLDLGLMPLWCEKHRRT